MNLQRYIKIDGIYQLLSEAHKTGRPIYIHSPTGVGKTAAVRYFYRNKKVLWLGEADGKLTAMPPEERIAEDTVIFDDVSFLDDSASQQYITSMIRNGRKHAVILGRPVLPVFLIPFVLAPVLNAWVFKLFVDVLGMNGFLYTLPWTTPAPIGIVLGCGLSPLAFVFAVVALVLDFVVYYPFFKTYDLQKCEEEAQIEAEELEALASDKAARMSDAFQGKTQASELSAAAPAPTKAAPVAEAASGEGLAGKKVLVLCAGGGTSGLLANALAKAAEERGIDLESAAGAYGAHLDIMPDFDLVVLAPQVASYYEDLKLDADRMGVKAAACEGRQYIALTRDGEAALEFVRQQLSE